jgi:DNA-binding MarR family transcriptional regulator
MKSFPTKDYLDYVATRYKVADVAALETFLEVVSVVRVMNNGMDNYFSKLGISHARFKVMINTFCYARSGGVSPALLAESIGVTRATITGLLDSLENDQLIERQPDPNDRRGLLIKLTAAGEAKLDSILPAHYERIGRAMSNLTHKEQNELTVLIRKFGQGLDELEKCAPNETDKNEDDSGASKK